MVVFFFQLILCLILCFLRHVISRKGLKFCVRDTVMDISFVLCFAALFELYGDEVALHMYLVLLS